MAEYTKSHMSASGSVAVGAVSTLAQRQAAGEPETKNVQEKPRIYSNSISR